MDNVIDLSFLDWTPKKKYRPWILANVVFIGAQNYELIRVEAEVRIDFVPGGFETKFKEPFAVPAELLLGLRFRRTETCRKHGTQIFDIEIQLPGFTMSMAKMNPKKFPRSIVEGELVGING